MANKQTKYTHITARCSQLMKALCYATLERCTGDTLSTAYWRLREGKGLLTYKDKQTLDAWSEQITAIRRYCATPASMDNDDHNYINRLRDELLGRMESYRNWLFNGSKPIYLTDRTSHKYSHITLELAVGEYNPDIIEASLEDQKEFWRKIDISKFLSCDYDVWKKTHIWLTDAPRYQILANIYDNLNMQMLPTDKVWQIRTDMEHRSSIGANINEKMYWLYDVPSKSVGHEGILEDNEVAIARFVLWRTKTKKMAKEKMKITDDVLGIMESFINSIRIPEFAQGNEDLEIGGE